MGLYTCPSHTQLNFKQACVLLLLLLGFGSVEGVRRERGVEGEYVNKWAVHIVGGLKRANQIAHKHALVNIGQIGSLVDYYLFENRRIGKRSVSMSHGCRRSLQSDPRVQWSKQQKVVKRVKREVQMEENGKEGRVEKKGKKGAGRLMGKRGSTKRKFSDPMWGRMWYLNRKGNNMNVLGAWSRGYTGKGVVVSVLDDGIEHNHTDIASNYDPEASYDVINNDQDPLPRYSLGNENSHGTKCAGEIAAVANNRKCMVGVAYNAKVGGIQMLDGDVTDAVEASAFSHKMQHIDIYSSSWGPDDNGMLVNGPEKLARKAFKEGVTKGRDGKGSIFIWASGNGGSFSDSCGCDGYASSIYTLSVAGVSENGSKPWYLEECTSTLATTYSSGDNFKERKIVTTNLRNTCGLHTGTSSSAAMASGMCALALQANSNLTWRDMQHIVILTARTSPFKKPVWTKNGVGRLVSHRFGYGLMDGLAMTLLAEKWETVPEQHVCYSEYKTFNQSFSDSFRASINSSGCQGLKNDIRHLEHVQATVWLQYGRRGDLQISLTSPNGTTSRLLGWRKKDFRPGSFTNWTFMSVFYWGENPSGEWKISVKNVAKTETSGTFFGWRLIFYGTETDPIGSTQYNFTSNDLSQHPSNYDYMDEHSGSSDEDEEDEERQLDRLNATLNSIINESDASTFQTPDNQPSQATLKCHVECKDDRCRGPGPHNCTECKHFTLLLDRSCVPECPATTYANAETFECQKCPEPCLDCVLSRKYVSDGSSLSNSSNASYDQASIDVDSRATENASSSSGHAQLKLRVMCTSCHPSQLLLVTTTFSTCLEECGPAFYPDATRTQCLECGRGCKDCLNFKTCHNCLEDFELLGIQCLPSCKPTQFRHVNHSCIRCHSECLTCFDGGATDCVTCAQDRLWERERCVANCSIGFYFESVFNHYPTCEMCDASCRTCVSASSQQCTSCSPPYSFYQNSCLSKCPQGHYKAEGSVCSPCHSHCVNCKGPSPNDCFECHNPRRLHKGGCVDGCPDGTYKTDVDTASLTPVRRCDRCHSSCTTCNAGSSMKCLTCPRGMFFSYGQCVANCSEKEHKVDDTCITCHHTCSTCNGPDLFNCLSCPVYLYMSVSMCFSKCPPGSYELDGRCVFCILGCLRCEAERADECLECVDGKVGGDGRCAYIQPSCHDNQYYNTTSRACLPCHHSCDSCKADGVAGCSSCRQKDVVLWQGVCHPCCPSLTTFCCVCSPSTGVCDNLVLSDQYDSSLTTSTSFKAHPTFLSTLPSLLPTTTFTPSSIAHPTTISPSPSTSLSTIHSPISNPLSTPCTPSNSTLTPSHPTSQMPSPTSIFLTTSSISYPVTFSLPNSTTAIQPTAHHPSQRIITILIPVLVILIIIVVTILIVFFFHSKYKVFCSSQHYRTVSTEQKHDLSTGRYTLTQPQAV